MTLRYRGISSIGGIFVVTALIVSLLALTYSISAISRASMDVIDRLRAEEAKLLDGVEWRVEGGTLYVRLRGGSDFAYAILWGNTSLPEVVRISGGEWTALPWSSELSNDVVIVTSSGALLHLDPPQASANATLAPGAVASEGFEYKTLGYYNPDAWILNSKLTPKEGGYSRELTSRLRILELTMQIYPDGVYERRDYIEVYLPVFKVISGITIDVTMRLNLTVSLNVEFKPEYKLRVNPYFNWIIYLDVGSLPGRRIFYHNGYYWTSYVSKPESITVEDVITGRTLGVVSWSTTPLYESNTWRYTGTRTLNVEVSRLETLHLQSSLSLDYPSYVTVLKVRIPSRILLKLDIMNADSKITYLESIKVYSIGYSTAP